MSRSRPRIRRTESDESACCPGIMVERGRHERHRNAGGLKEDGREKNKETGNCSRVHQEFSQYSLLLYRLAKCLRSKEARKQGLLA